MGRQPGSWPFSSVCADRDPADSLGANLGHKDHAESLAVDPQQGGLWLGFYEGGIVHFKDGQVRASYGAADGLGDGVVGGFRFDADGTSGRPQRVGSAA